jgi:hypothetical protein
MTKRHTAEPPSERQLSKQLGISRVVFWRAKQVASIPEEEFEAMIESDQPPTVSQLVEHARGQPDRSQGVSIRLKPDQLAALDMWIARQPEPWPSRPEAIRRLAQMSLEGSQAPPTQSKDIAEEALANTTRPRFSIDDVE